METLLKTLDCLERSYNVSIFIKDLSGQMLKSPSLSPLIRSHFAHDNPYCVTVKSSRPAHQHCFECSHRKLYEKIVASKHPAEPFWGTCYGGVRECVFPILYRKKHPVAAMIVGSFTCDELRATSSIERISAAYDLDIDKLQSLYAKLSSRKVPPHEVLEGIFTICARYLASLVDRYLDYDGSSYDLLPPDGYDKHERLEFIIQYIKTNLGSQLSIDEIASACCCSASTVSHLFSELMGQGVTSYIIDERLKWAMSLLAGGNMSCSAVSIQCGFGSNKHFSSTFRRRTGMSPTEYQAKYRGAQSYIIELLPKNKKESIQK